MGPLTAIALALVLLVLRAALWAGEAALSRVSLERARELATLGKSGVALLRLKAKPEECAAALRVGLTFALVFAASLAAYAGTHLPVSDAIARASPGLALLAGPILGGLLVTGAATIIDLVSRSLGIASGEGYALGIARGVDAVAHGIAPLLRSVADVLDLVLAPLGAKVRFAPAPPPLEEIERFLAEEAGRRLDQKAPALIHSIFELSEKSAREVMVPRTEISAVELRTDSTELLRVLAEEGHSRMPVYREQMDHVVGVLHARDLVPLLTHPELIKLPDLIRPATFVPWSQPIGELLRELQLKRIHMAMVVDEYGGFMGVVTLEDILREIVGELGDEYDTEGEHEIENFSDGTFGVQATISIDAFDAHFSVSLPEGDYETLAGFLNALAGAIPELGDRFFFGGLQFTVIERSPRQLERVRVARMKKPAE